VVNGKLDSAQKRLIRGRDRERRQSDKIKAAASGGAGVMGLSAEDLALITAALDPIEAAP
jgi:hypothetical protein